MGLRKIVLPDFIDDYRYRDSLRYRNLTQTLTFSKIYFD